MKIIFLEPGEIPMSPESIQPKKKKKKEKKQKEENENMDFELDDLPWKQILIIVALFAVFMCAIAQMGWLPFIGKKDAAAQQPTSLPTLTSTPMPTPPHTPEPPKPTTQQQPTIQQQQPQTRPTLLPTISQEQVQATATYIAAINRPAQGISTNTRLYIGSIDLNPTFGFCAYTSIGFIASGRPAFLYIPAGISITDDLLEQQVVVRGLAQNMDQCQYEVITVQEITPLAKMAQQGQIMYTGGPSQTLTATTIAAYRYTPPRPFGLATAAPGKTIFGTPPSHLTPTATITNTGSFTWVPPNKWPTSTPYPTYTPAPPQTIVEEVEREVTVIVEQLPTAEPTRNSIYGELFTKNGCSRTTLAVTSGGDQERFVILTGAQPPPRDPDYIPVYIVGESSTDCGQSILASDITYYDHTPTPTHTPTETATPTPTPTASPTPGTIIAHGPVIQVAGCTASNLKVENGDIEEYFIIFSGAVPPTGNPAGQTVTVIGQPTTVCNGPGILAQIATWATATPTSTPIPTNTATMTPTPTETNTPTPTHTLTATTPITP